MIESARLLFFLILLIPGLLGGSESIDELQVYGPNDLHSNAIELYVKMRKDNSEMMDYEGPFLNRARIHAEKRLQLKPESDLLKKSYISTEKLENSAIGNHYYGFQLPMPDQKDSYLSLAINSMSSNHLVKYEAAADAIKFHEEIGLGALAKAGALLPGNNGEWLKFAEDKLKRENTLDYQSLLWELGIEIAESQRRDINGSNLQYNDTGLLENMNSWFLKRGGKLLFVKSDYEGNSSRLIATELIDKDEVIVSVPMNLIMCQQTARNVVIFKRGRYLGEELQKTFDKNEVWGLVIFLLHEYYKEVNGEGSKWGPFIRTLRMRILSTDSLQTLKGTLVESLFKDWMKSADALMWWSAGAEGPCSPTTGICRSKPLEKTGDSRFSIHQMRWAYWIVMQNSIKVKHATTGFEFLALVPYYTMMQKRMGSGGSVTFSKDGNINIKIGEQIKEGDSTFIHPGNLSDSELFMRYFYVPKEKNHNNYIKLSLPGAIPKGSKFHYCLKGTEKEKNNDECKGSFRSESMFWKSKVLSEWRNLMNLPPRLQELRMWATRLHIYGGQEEMKLLNAANHLIAGLPIPVDQMPAEEQVMMLGLARSVEEAALIVHGPNVDLTPPQLYSAPDPNEDPDAKRAMENLAFFALQTQNVLSSGNAILNATNAVIDHIRNFYIHGIIPMAGLDELDEFLLKKIGMLSHCGFENDMKITNGNISEELLCAMRVHLMNETEMNAFCPSEVRVWQENCLDVEFLNFTAISLNNELEVVKALRGSLNYMLEGYSISESELEFIEDIKNYGIRFEAIRLKIRERDMLINSLSILEQHEQNILNGDVIFQLESKILEREEAIRRKKDIDMFLEKISQAANEVQILSSIEVNTGIPEHPKLNLTLNVGEDIIKKVVDFCNMNKFSLENVEPLKNALISKIVNPAPVTLLLGVIVPNGNRRILGIDEKQNVTFQTGVFCHQNNITRSQCLKLEERVYSRINVTFIRQILTHFQIDSPDGRKLKLVVYEGDQHDLLQFVSDFFEYYHLPSYSLAAVVDEIHKRLPSVVLTIPVSVSAKRLIHCRISLNGNLSNTVEGFSNVFEIDPETKLKILKFARHGLAPGSYMV